MVQRAPKHSSLIRLSDHSLDFHASEHYRSRPKQQPCTSFAYFSTVSSLVLSDLQDAE
jgi:hypothetical protein